LEILFEIRKCNYSLQLSNKLSGFIVKAILLILSLLITPQVQAKSQCNGLYKSTDFIENTFWSQNEVLLKGTEKPFSFSFDSEITYNDILKAMKNDPDGLQLLQENTVLNIDVMINEIIENTKISEAKLRSFHLLGGRDKNKKEFRLWEIDPSFFISSPKLKLANISQDLYLASLDSVFSVYMKTKDYRYAVGKGGDDIEVRHENFETNPSRFKKMMDDFQSQFTYPNTHLHVGIPATVKFENLMAIVRAIEVRTVFGLILQRNGTSSKISYNHFTSLDEKAPELTFFRVNESGTNATRRGVIKLKISRWKEPFATHDLEIRQYYDFAEGLKNLALAAELANRRKKLLQIDFELPANLQIKDPYVGNVHGAVWYASAILRESKNSKDQELGSRLRLLLNSYSKPSERPDSKELKQLNHFYEKLADFIEQNNIMDKLNADAFAPFE
jgi:hypothetical protein